MRFARPALLLFLCCLVPGFVAAQQSASTATPPQPVSDPQALSVLNQALSVAGGAQAVTAISDYTASGKIVYYPSGQVDGTVTVMGTNSQELRIDATLPAGVRSWAVHDGIVTTKTESGTIDSFGSNANLPSSDAYPYETPLFAAGLLFPVEPLAVLTSHEIFSILYNGTTQVDGHAVYDIVVHLDPSGSSSAGTQLGSGPTREIFVDTTTFQIVMVRDRLPRDVRQEVHYSDYRAIDGVLMPFSVTESIDGQAIWSIQLNQITFNSGLQASAFVIQ
jgi:hypothetical protein